MVTRIEHTVYDDLDNSTGTVATYTFALEGVTYEIDLGEPNLARLRDALAPFITVGRRQPRTTTTTAGGARRGSAVTRPGIRAWWAAKAHELGLPAHRSHGKIPTAVTTAYDNHH